MNEVLEGWYTDPYGRHEARWMSERKPTGLVRDGRSESRDPLVADEPFKMAPVPIQTDTQRGADLRRADDPLTQLSSDEDEETMRDSRPVAWASRWGSAGFVLGLLGSLAFGKTFAQAAVIGIVVGILVALGSVRPRFWD